MNKPGLQKFKLIKAIILRLLYGAVSLLFISFITFLADEIAPGDIATVRAGEKATPEQVQRLREELGLTRPFLIRYGEYIGKAVRFDFGNSYRGTQEPVSDVIGKTLPTTTKIALLAILLAAIVGIFAGTLAAVKENKAADKAVLSFSTLGVTIPNYVLLPFLVYIFSIVLGQLPIKWEFADRRVGPEFFYLILPVFVLSLRPMATLTRLMRASMIDTFRQEYIGLAIAKGVRPMQILWKHAFRNAILPVLTMIGTSFGYLLTGSFVIETAYGIRGLGFEAIDAISNSDTPVILATTLVTGAMFVGVNLLVDLVQPLIDPRIRESQV